MVTEFGFTDGDVIAMEQAGVLPHYDNRQRLHRGLNFTPHELMEYVHDNDWVMYADDRPIDDITPFLPTPPDAHVKENGCFAITLNAIERDGTNVLALQLWAYWDGGADTENEIWIVPKA